MRSCARSNSSAALALLSTTPMRSELTQQWRRQVGCRLRLGEQRGARPLALVGYQVRGNAPDSLIPLDCLRFFSLFDERDAEDRLTTRLLGFRASLTAIGIELGGLPGNLIDKDLRLPPARGGNGRRLDAADARLVEAAFAWERHLERHSRHPHYPRRASLKLPDWWCAVQASAEDLPTRFHRGRTLVQLEQAIVRGFEVEAVFGDLAHVPKRQVVACQVPEHLLCGTAGVTTFDLYHSRFRRTPDAIR